MKNKSSNERESRTQEIKRYIGAVTEDFQGRLDGVIDLVKITNEKLDGVVEQVGNISEDVSILKKDVSVLKEDVSVMKTDISVIKGDLKQEVDYKEFTALERRVGILESKVRK